jgi:hypothetical protein
MGAARRGRCADEFKKGLLLNCLEDKLKGGG